ncbi:family 43 glycosylhydrolase [Galbibacter sp. EGI 63066]|uniref:family 43 glycosylhydrolase n=1 Tax=Galbibacter sp. EGI 63066 TaxID=2993559 RepID=UPI002248F25D|nr:family 43 glycosylhydrolase [Galbibacter sp. EGI 63066]MCX2678480.1 family 43 glycosylhydrolase [Galbibacter sp. EGI 63066]
MKRAFSLSVILCLVFGQFASAQTKKHNIFRPGAIWEDTEGVHINAHGGGFLYQNRTYYWYGEHKGKTSKAHVGINVYSSKDLYNWKKEGVALSVSDDPDSEVTKGCVMERPKVIYNEKTEKYVMWFHLELKDQGYRAAKTAVAISDNPTGPFQYLRSFRPNAKQWPQNFKDEWKKSLPEEDSLKWWTPKWHKAVKEGLFVHRDFEKGQMSRDMTLFVDDDGKAYHIHSAEENLSLHISELTDDYLDFTGKYVTVAPAGHNEAPAIFKQDGTYYMIASGATGWDPNAARSFSSKSIWGPWKPLNNPAVGKESDVTFRSQSTYILPVAGKENAFIFMADRWNPKNHIDGRYIWLPLQVVNGQPVIKWYNEWKLDFFDKKKIPVKKDIPIDSIRLSDPAILADKKTSMYYMTGTGGMLWKSKDLKLWDGPYEVAMTDPNSWMGTNPMIWAAELHQYNDKYYYFATFTNRDVKIDTVKGNIIERRASHVLVSDQPDGPYTPMKDTVYLPENKPTLDGTFWVDKDGKPYMIYCHEWLQNWNGTMEKILLKPDLSGTVGKRKIMFFASDSPWSKEKDEDGAIVPNKVTDGPYLFRTGTGRLGIIWTSWVHDVYTQGVAYSESGTLDGPWIHEEEPITPPNFGHGMLFQTFEGKTLMSLHSHRNENDRYIRIPNLFEVDLSGDKLIIGKRYGQ